MPRNVMSGLLKSNLLFKIYMLQIFKSVLINFLKRMNCYELDFIVDIRNCVESGEVVILLY